MKKKSLAELLRKLESAQRSGDPDAISLNEILSKKMLKGGYDTNNTVCGPGNNSSCSNGLCGGSHNDYCHNTNCND